jgi:hypothetical protein
MRLQFLGIEYADTLDLSVIDWVMFELNDSQFLQINFQKAKKLRDPSQQQLLSEASTYPDRNPFCVGKSMCIGQKVTMKGLERELRIVQVECPEVSLAETPPFIQVM